MCFNFEEIYPSVSGIYFQSSWGSHKTSNKDYTNILGNYACNFHMSSLDKGGYLLLVVHKSRLHLDYLSRTPIVSDNSQIQMWTLTIPLPIYSPLLLNSVIPNTPVAVNDRKWSTMLASILIIVGTWLLTCYVYKYLFVRMLHRPRQ